LKAMKKYVSIGDNDDGWYKLRPEFIKYSY
jgi:hypothetical protein